MKKIALLMVVIIIGTSAFAAAPKAAPAAKPAASSAPAAAKRMGFGLQGFTVTSNNITMPTLEYPLSDEMMGEIGLAFASRSAAGASVSNFTLALALKMKLGNPVGSIQPQWGVGLAYTSNPALVNNTSNILIALNVGAKYWITPDLSLEGNLIPLAYNSFTAAGATTTTMSVLNSASGLPAATLGAHIYL